MPVRSKSKSYDLEDFRYDKSRPGLAKCKFCPTRQNANVWLEQRYLAGHADTAQHQRLRKKYWNSSQKKEQVPVAASSSTETSTMHDEIGDIHAHDVIELSPFDPAIDIATAGPYNHPSPEYDAHETVADPPLTAPPIFSAGRVEQDPMYESFNRALNAAENGELPCEGGTTWDDNESEDNAEDWNDEELRSHLFDPAKRSEWFPYPDKAQFLTDLLFNSPRMRFSRTQQRAVLSWAKELGAKVPAHETLRKTQRSLLKELGDPTERQVSGRGTVWYLNKIGHSIAQDMSNPVSREGMAFYPDDAGKQRNTVWQSDKLRSDIPDRLLTPTVRHRGDIYYVNELVRCSNSRWFLPKRWFKKDGRMMASGYHVRSTETGLLVNAEELQIMSVSEFRANFPQILAENDGVYPLAHESAAFAAAMPHPMREKAGTRMVYSVPLAVFIDDVSGNKSKQWNKHHSVYLSNGCIPREKLESEFHVRFVATSPHAAPLELMQGVRADIEQTFKEPIPAWDCELGEEVLLAPYALLFAGDNPMQAELCSCAGLGSNYFCRTCHAGGTREYKQSDAGFADTLKAGQMRQSSETKEEVFQQILTSLEPEVVTTLEKAVRQSGVKDALAQPILDVLVKMGQDLRKANPDGSAHSPDEVQTILIEELKKHQSKGDGIINPLLDMDGVDIHSDTPTEILHTILLGIVKYYWAQTLSILEKAKLFSTFRARLHSIHEDGLDIPPIQADYMCQYKGGLIGKHFKTISQVMAFAVEGLVPTQCLEAWLAIGRLTVLLWHTTITDIDVYCDNLRHAIDDFVKVTCQCSPSILITKPKFHFLLHLPFFIRRFGPAVMFSTERYESYNAVFRAASIYSNHQSPSRDIGWSFAGIDRVKHIVTGGWWKDTKTGQWVRAGARVTQHLVEHAEFAAVLGLPKLGAVISGSVVCCPLPPRTSSAKKISRNARPALLGKDSLAFQKMSPELFERTTAQALKSFRPCLSISALNGDQIGVAQNAVVLVDGVHFFAALHEIITSENTVLGVLAWTFVTVQLFDLDDSPHPILKMPTVVRSSTWSVLTPKDIICAVNLQHNCHSSGCKEIITQQIIHEREETSLTRSVLKHEDSRLFVVNLHALHNHRAIQHALPSRLATQLRCPVLSPTDAANTHRLAAEAIRSRKRKGDATISSPPETAGVHDLEGVDETVGAEPDRHGVVDVESETVDESLLEVEINPVFDRLFESVMRSGPSGSTKSRAKGPPDKVEKCTVAVIRQIFRDRGWETPRSQMLKADVVQSLHEHAQRTSTPITLDDIKRAWSTESSSTKRVRPADDDTGNTRKRRRGDDGLARIRAEEELRGLFFECMTL